ncbi:MAG: carbamoyltransferase HypF [Kiritimatiellae bacterium]|nr:carbamoyltransferase HypF [Kiritimatiellia bacterium]
MSKPWAETSGLHVRLRGRVQGVGFRPAAWRLAQKLGLGGWVRNDATGAELLLLGPRPLCERFLADLPDALPPAARIESADRSWPPPPDAPPADPNAPFAILPSPEPPPGLRPAGILPDLATCPDCLREMLDPHDRRHLYPFTNCTACGPRASILLRLPYDRANTTMRTFRMCPDCEAEYRSPSSRRFHAQPNACPRCGPQLVWLDPDAPPGAPRRADRAEALSAAAAALRAGRIVAVKGIGGFHLVVDARDPAAVRRLRLRKHRETKPLAVMFPSPDAIARECEVSPAERAALLSPAAPIVLLFRRDAPSALAADALAPGLPWLGAFLPYTPLHHLLLRALGFPVVATSGNLTDEPICTGNDEALARLSGIADAFLLHDRPIARPLDDSVVAYLGATRIPIRRGRGMAPYTIPLPGAPDAALAAGADLKNTLALCTGGRAMVGPHVGDLEHDTALRLWERTAADWLSLRGLSAPTVWAADAHPAYASAQAATRAAAAARVPLVRIPHHQAHIAACMADNALDGPVLGIAWDGTGWDADDRTIRGGEFYHCATHRDMHPVASLRPFPLPGGDAAARDPRRAHLGILHELGLTTPPDLFPSPEAALLQSQLHSGLNTWRTTSAGRLFDAFSSLLDLCRASRHEGEAAMLLESAAWRALRAGAPVPPPYPFTLDGPTLDWSPAWHAAAADLASAIPPPAIALRIHATFAAMMHSVARREALPDVCLSGGCFQNRLLLRLATAALSPTHRVHPHLHTPPNDASISLGQLASLPAP